MKYDMYKDPPKEKSFNGKMYRLEGVYDTRKDAQKDADIYKKWKTPYRITKAPKYCMPHKAILWVYD